MTTSATAARTLPTPRIARELPLVGANHSLDALFRDGHDTDHGVGSNAAHYAAISRLAEHTGFTGDPLDASFEVYNSTFGIVMTAATLNRPAATIFTELPHGAAYRYTCADCLLLEVGRLIGMNTADLPKPHAHQPT